MTTDTLTLTDFLLARISEEEDEARRMVGWARPGERAHRIMLDCEAKRRIIVNAADVLRCGDETRRTHEYAMWAAAVNLAHTALNALAMPYTGHPDYCV